MVRAARLAERPAARGLSTGRRCDFCHERGMARGKGYNLCSHDPAFLARSSSFACRDLARIEAIWPRQRNDVSKGRFSTLAAFRRSIGRLVHVCFGSKADISQCNRHVRFTPESGRGSARLEGSKVERSRGENVQACYLSGGRKKIASLTKQFSTILPADPDSRISLCARAASASGNSLPTTGRRVPFSRPSKSPAWMSASSAAVIAQSVNARIE